jgi:hypothetical protein
VTVSSLNDDDDDGDDSCFSVASGRIVGDKNIINFLKLKILI